MAIDLERIVIVGAGPAGLSTARAYRECGGEAEVTLVGEEPLPPYQRPPLTKDFLRGELDASELPIEPAEWFEANDVKLLLGSRVSAIDPGHGSVTLEGYVRLPADAIVLAAAPSRHALRSRGSSTRTCTRSERSPTASGSLTRRGHRGHGCS